MPPNPLNNNELRSEEVNEIISQIPSWIIRWGITLLFSLFAIVLTITWFIQYPDVITADVIITSNPAPTTLVARNSGKLILLKQEGEIVKPGDLIGYIDGNGSVEDVLLLENGIEGVKGEGGTFINKQLGDIQPYYSSYLSALSNVSYFETNFAFERQIEQLEKQKMLFRRGIVVAKDQLSLSRQELQLSKEQFRTDSILHQQKVIADLEFSKSRGNWLQKQRLAKNEEAALLGDELQLNNVEKQILDLELQRAEQNMNLVTALQNSKSELMAAIQKWKENNLLIANAKGRIALLDFFQNQKHVDQGQPLISIIPIEGTLIARAEMPITGSGKVKVGQRVNIRLANYPFEQYGIIKGKLSSISLVPNNEKYLAEIELSEGLVTNMRKTLEFKQKLTGTTEFITEDLRLMERFFYQMRGLVYN